MIAIEDQFIHFGEVIEERYNLILCCKSYIENIEGFQIWILFY